MKRVLKTATLALLAIVCLESTSADNDLVSKDCNIQTATAAQAEQQNTTEPSPEVQKIYDKLHKMAFAGAQPNQVNIKKENDIFICHLRNITDPGSKERLGDAIVVVFYHNNNKEKYFKLKKEGKKPDITKFPIQEVYLIPLIHKGINLKLYSNDFFEFMVDEDRYDSYMYSNVYMFKQEIYPEKFYELYAAGSAVSDEDAERYFNFGENGWIAYHDYRGDERCGLTKNFPISAKDGTLILEYIKKNYPNISISSDYGVI